MPARHNQPNDRLLRRFAERRLNLIRKSKGLGALLYTCQFRRNSRWRLPNGDSLVVEVPHQGARPIQGTRDADPPCLLPLFELGDEHDKVFTIHARDTLGRAAGRPHYMARIHHIVYLERHSPVGGVNSPRNIARRMMATFRRHPGRYHLGVSMTCGQPGCLQGRHTVCEPCGPSHAKSQLHSMAFHDAAQPGVVLGDTEVLRHVGQPLFHSPTIGTPPLPSMSPAYTHPAYPNDPPRPRTS